MPAARLITILWRDIPAQVTAKEGRNRAKAVLSDRFQVAIDAAATRAGLINADDYLAEWRDTESSCEEDLWAAVHSEARRLEDQFSSAILQEYIRNYGWAP